MTLPFGTHPGCHDLPLRAVAKLTVSSTVQHLDVFLNEDFSHSTNYE